MISLAALNGSSFPREHVVACDREHTIDWAQFLADIEATGRQVSSREHSGWALYEDDAYRFAVGLFALLAKGKRVYLPGENNPAVTKTLKSLGASCIGLFPCESTLPVTTRASAPNESSNAFSLTGEMVVFTSGTTGEPKALPKSLAQIDAELESLEQAWGDRLGQSLILSGVSQQHLYGLLFLVLWPICTGRAFWRKRFDSPAALMTEAANHDQTSWIMSPAYLHRLDDDLPWASARRCTRIVFSSGGLLRTAAAQRIQEHLGRLPVEVLGSSETGGIAWREQNTADDPWTPFPCIHIDQSENGALKIRSPFLPDAKWYVTDDAAKIQKDGRFLLGSRLDRIVKIEGKRVSLPAVEKTLGDHQWVKEAYTVPLNRRRQCVGAVLLITSEGDQAYRELGHHRFGLALRKHCKQYLPAASVPRYWRLRVSLPRNAQGKVLQNTALEMFERTNYPTVLHQEHRKNGCRLILFVEPDSPYFEGHFPGAAILPGVTQLFWVEHFARIELGLTGEFQDMRAIKFRQLVRPGNELRLDLDWSAENQRLTFTFESQDGTHSQGRMIFRGDE